MGPEFNALDSVKRPCKDREIWRCNDIWSEGHVMMDTETAETQLQVHEAFLETTGRVTNISKPTRKEPEWRLDYNFCKIPLTFDSSLDPVCLSGSQPRVRPDGQSLSSEHWKAVKKQTKTTSTLPLLFRDLGVFLFFFFLFFFFLASCPVKFQNSTFLRNKPAIYLRPFKSPSPIPIIVVLLTSD